MLKSGNQLKNKMHQYASPAEKKSKKRSRSSSSSSSSKSDSDSESESPKTKAAKVKVETAAQVLAHELRACVGTEDVWWRGGQVRRTTGLQGQRGRKGSCWYLAVGREVAAIEPALDQRGHLRSGRHIGWSNPAITFAL